MKGKKMVIYRYAPLLVLMTMFAAVASRAPAQSVESFRLMTFNVWSGENSASGRAKLVEIIQAGEADIVGLQEMGNSAGQQVATELGFHYHQQSGGDIQIVSRYPIIGQSQSNRGAEIELSPGQSIWLFNSHLAAYPYQPYDLRDGLLPANEAAVVAAANSARGSQVSAYLNEMAGALASSVPVFFTGDFNEPSHLDWTQAAADASARAFDFAVEYPASKRIADAGMIDSFRAVRPDEVHDRGDTWTPGYPPPVLSNEEVHDRIDFVYHSGPGVFATSADVLGLDISNPNTDIEIAGYNADHRAVVVSFTVPDDCFLLGDLDGDCELGGDDWLQYLSGQHTDLAGLTPQQAYSAGDFNGDFLNNHQDFVLFKTTFERVNGAGSFATMLAGVPEPMTVWLLGIGTSLWGVIGRRGCIAR